MAIKKYAYYNKGNKIALVEKDVSTSSGNKAVAHCTIGGHSTKTACEAAGGQWIPGSSGTVETLGKYKSPVDDSTKGLEIEYSYSPTYSILAGADINEVTRGGSGSLGAEYPFFGYTSKGGYLAFVQAHTNNAWNVWTASGYDEEFVVDDYILVQNSGIWNGLHKVKSRESDGGMIVTHTPFAAKFSYEGNIAFDATDDKMTGFSASDDKPGIDNIFGTDSSVVQYFVCVDLEDIQNKAIWKVTRTGAGELTPSHSIGWYQGEWKESTASVTEEANEACTIYKVVKDNLIVYPRNAIAVMENEDFDLDVTRYQSNAIVYYLKAKNAEDMGELKLREYFMGQFYKQLEKGSNSRSYGPRIVQGKGMTRT